VVLFDPRRDAFPGIVAGLLDRQKVEGIIWMSDGLAEAIRAT